MARGENPGTVISHRVHSDVSDAYDQNTSFGHASAGKDLVLDINGNLGADGVQILGKFLDLDKNGDASVMTSGDPILLIKDDSTVSPGDKLVCAGGGKVKSAAASAAGNTAGRFRVWRVLSDSDGGAILALPY